MRFIRWAKLIAIQLAICLVLLEVACQIYYYVAGGAQVEALRNSPNFYYQRSDDPVLAYELAKGKQASSGGRVLKINQFGFRENNEELYGNVRRVCLLGDSVAFGYDISQEGTLAPTLQRQLDPDIKRVKFFNCGVPGYSLGEMPNWLERAFRTYKITDAVYLLNLNDFSRRDTMYEGADNGMYRFFNRPQLMSPFLIGKAIYRHHKGAGLTSTGWYRWLYEGTRSWGFERLTELQEIAARDGIRLAVGILPAGVAYSKEGYLLADEEKDISAYLKAAGITQFELTPGMSANDFDSTDHPTPEGLKVLAALVARFVDQWLPAH